MLSNFLLENKKRVEEQKNILLSKIDSLKIERDETNKFISILDNSTDKQLISLSPFAINEEDRKKIQQLKIRLKEINKSIVEYETDLSAAVKLIEQYDSNLIEAKKLERARYDLEEQAFEGMDSYGIRRFRLNVLSTQEQERARIARDLHDSPVQLLTALSFKLELCARLIDLDPIRSKLELLSASEALKESITEMRSIIYDLRPMALDDLGLKVSLERELSRLEKASGVEITLSIKGDIDHNPTVMNSTIFRIVQEACNNAIKHAKPSKIEVSFEVTNSSIDFHIIDNGLGFDTSSKEVKTEKEWYGFGMNTMKERIFLLSGKLKVKSREGVGTDIFVRIPITKCEV